MQPQMTQLTQDSTLRSRCSVRSWPRTAATPATEGPGCTNASRQTESHAPRPTDRGALYLVACEDSPENCQYFALARVTLASNILNHTAYGCLTPSTALELAEAGQCRMHYIDCRAAWSHTAWSHSMVTHSTHTAHTQHGHTAWSHSMVTHSTHTQHSHTALTHSMVTQHSQHSHTAWSHTALTQYGHTALTHSTHTQYGHTALTHSTHTQHGHTQHSHTALCYVPYKPALTGDSPLRWGRVYKEIDTVLYHVWYNGRPLLRNEKRRHTAAGPAH